jgi:hypothetical protein
MTVSGVFTEATLTKKGSQHIASAALATLFNQKE